MDENDIIAILETSDDDFIEALKNLESRLLKKIIREFNKLDKNAGKLVFNDDSNALIARIKQFVFKEVKDQLERETKGFLKNFDLIYDGRADLFHQDNDLKIRDYEKLIKPLYEDTIKNITERMFSETNIKEFIGEPIRKTIFNAVFLGKRYQDLEDELRNMIDPKDEKNGLIRQRAKQISRDSINQFDGAINEKMRVELNLDGFIFLGTLVKDSRKNCAHMLLCPNNARYFIGKEKVNEPNMFARFSRGAGRFAFSDLPKMIKILERGAGWIPGTTAETYLQNRNGYNCRHFPKPIKLL